MYAERKKKQSWPEAMEMLLAVLQKANELLNRDVVAARAFCCLKA